MEECCGDEMVVEYGAYICQKCGMMNPYKACFVPDRNTYFQRNKSAYVSIDYIKDKMLMVCCLKPCYIKGYSDVVKELKINREINNIFKFYDCDDVYEFRKILKKNNYSIFYPYIYLLIKDIYNITLINLSRDDIDTICSSFNVKWNKIKKEFDDKKNIVSINIIIKLLLEYRNNEGYKYIILPNNYKKYERQVKKIIEN